VFKVEMLAAQQGDAVWIEYGAPGAVHRVLIDAGTPASADAIRQRIERLPPDQRRFDLLVVTHIDTDHIGGVLKLLADRPAGLAFDDVWFNAWRHIEHVESSRLGPIDGEILSTALDKLGWSWNAKFDGRAVMVGAAGAPPSRELRGGMTLTVLSPAAQQLAKLRGNWRSVIRAAGLDPADPDRWARLLDKAARKGVSSSILGGRLDVPALGRSAFESDKAPANGSTIALLAEFEGASCLLSGDAFAGVMADAIGRLLHARGQRRLAVDAFKLPHHGSRYNVSNDLLNAVASPQYLFSTSGAIFGHPDDEAVARVLAAGARSAKTLHFNYPADTLRANYAKIKKRQAPNWEQAGLRRDFRYDTRYAADDDAGLALELQR
jgi:beta-lactamase superfamily II metal-dependent hydrolase